MVHFKSTSKVYINVLAAKFSLYYFSVDLNNVVKNAYCVIIDDKQPHYFIKHQLNYDYFSESFNFFKRVISFMNDYGHSYLINGNHFNFKMYYPFSYAKMIFYCHADSSAVAMREYFLKFNSPSLKIESIILLYFYFIY